jgi:hypothetical protein
MNTRTAVLASLLAASSFASLAQGVFQHPAVSTPPQAAGVDPSTFLVGHPASPTWQVRHANAEHPAIAMRAETTRSSIDPNTFIVQPPAHAQWRQPGSAGTEGAVALVRFN